MTNIDEKRKIFEILKKEENDIKNIGKVLGKGGFGQVREITMENNKKYAGKLIEKRISKNNKELEEVEYGEILRGRNIINFNKIIKKKIDEKEYNLIIMEKALLRDFEKLY